MSSNKSHKLGEGETDDRCEKSSCTDLGLSNLTLVSNDPQNEMTEALENCKIEDKDGFTSEVDFVIRNNTLNLSKQNLSTFNDAWLGAENMDLVQKIILESNNLRELPNNFFKALPLLKWLDLRNNLLTSLPKDGLKNHESLEVLLLENNQIKSLPPELGTIISLKAINIRNNPLEDPPTDIVQSGTEQIKQYLNEIFQGDSNQNNKNLNSSNISGNAKPNSAVDKKNKKLFSLHAKLCKGNSKSSSKKVLRTQSEKYIDNAYGKPISESMLEERFKSEIVLAKLKQKLSKQDAEIQAQKTKENVSKWKDRYKRMQAIKINEKMSNGGKLDYQEPATTAPFGVSKENFRMISDRERIFNKMTREKKIKPSNMSFAKKIQLEKAKLNHENFLKNKVAEHIASMKNRSYSGMEPHEIMLTAEKDLEIALKLQEEINKRRRELEFGISNIPVGLYDN